MEGGDGVEGESEGGGGEGARSLLEANRDSVVALEETAEGATADLRGRVKHNFWGFPQRFFFYYYYFLGTYFWCGY